MWTALGGLAVAVALIVFGEGIMRFDGWARQNGFGWLLAGNRTYAVTFARAFQLVAAGFAVFCAILLFERI
jgi:hypothetical protein